MANIQHETLDTGNVHVPGYVQASDPGAVGAGKLWTDTSAGTGAWTTKMRNIANTGWEALGSSGYSGVQGVSGFSGISGAFGATGISGYSGKSGFSGNNPGTSGYSGISGFSGGTGVATYITSFIKSTLSASGILVVSHSLTKKYNIVQIYNENDRLILPDAVILTDANTLSVDLSSYYATFTGTWRVIVVSGAN